MKTKLILFAAVIILGSCQTTTYEELESLSFENGAKGYKIAMLKYRNSKMPDIDVAAIDSIFSNDPMCHP